ncbi:hypothetical protein [Streptomyces sp. NPDC046862]|uniref:hypothetical protein n=1 Tax=Streptomyces sp. NPDC046862 TaxID=3154603 RepID=UPI0034516D1D
MHASTSIPKSKLDQIRALQRVADDPGTPAKTAEFYREKVRDLIARYGVEQAMLHRLNRSDEKPIGRRFTTGNPWSMARTTLLNGLALAMGCELIDLGPVKGTGREVHVFGFRSDIDRLDLLYTSLQLQMLSELAATPVPQHEQKRIRSWRYGWLIGFVNAVVERVDAAEKRVQGEEKERAEGATSVALVLADRASAVLAAFHNAYPPSEVRSTQPGASREGGAGAGRYAGSRADIGNTRLGRSFTAITE